MADQNPQDQQISLDDWEKRTFEHYGVPEGLRQAVVGNESGGDINAKSPTGVTGRYQMTEATAKSYGLDRNDQWQQPVAAAKHLRMLYDGIRQSHPDFSDKQAWLGASAKYYYGENAFDKDGNLSNDSRDNLSTPAKYATSIAQKWSAFDKGAPAAQQAPQQPAPTPQPAEQMEFDLSGGKPKTPPKNLNRLTRLIANFEALKQDGQKDAAANQAAQIQREFGDVMEVGTGTGGWSYVKPKAGSGINYNPTTLVESANRDLNEAADRKKYQRQQEEFAQKPWLTQQASRLSDAFTEGGLDVLKAGRQALGAGFGVARGLNSGNFTPVDFPEQRAKDEALAQEIAERKKGRPSSLLTDVGEGIVRGIPTTAGIIAGTALTGGGLPAAMLTGGGITAAGADWRDPKRALIQTGINTVAPIIGGKLGSAAGEAIASRLANPVAQAVTRGGGELVGGAAGNVLGTGGEQLAFEGRLNPRELAKAGLVGAALNVPGAVSAARTPIPLETRPGAEPPKVDPREAAINAATAEYGQAVEAINRSAVDPATKAAQLAQAGADYRAARKAAQQPPQAEQPAPQAPTEAAAPTPQLPEGVSIIRPQQGEQIPARVRGQRQFAIDIEGPDGPESVIVRAPQGSRESDLRPVIEQALRPATSEAPQEIPAAQPGPVVSEAVGRATPPPPRQPVASVSDVFFTRAKGLLDRARFTGDEPMAARLLQQRLGVGQDRAARLIREVQRSKAVPGPTEELPQPTTDLTGRVRGAIPQPASSMEPRGLLGPAATQAMPAENGPYPNAPETVQIPGRAPTPRAEDMPTVGGLAPRRQTAETLRRPVVAEPQRQTGEIPRQAPASRQASRPFESQLLELPERPALTPPLRRPGGRVGVGRPAEPYAGGELQRYSRPLEGQPVEVATQAAPQEQSRPATRVPKATAENIDDLRTRYADLDRLRYDRRGHFTGDLRDEYRELGSAIKGYENEQARAGRGKRFDENTPPPGQNMGRQRAGTPAEAAARRQALQGEDTAELMRTSTPGRKVTQEAQLPPGLKVSESHATREDARQGHFERFNDDELVNEIHRMEDVRNQGIRGKSKLSRQELEANNFDLKVATEMQKDRRRIQQAQGVEPGERIAPRTPGRQAKKAAPETRIVTHPNPDLNGKPVLAETKDGRVLVQNPDNKSGVSVVKDRGAVPTGAMPELTTPGAPESPLKKMGVAPPTGKGGSYAIPAEAMPELQTKPKRQATPPRRTRGPAAQPVAAMEVRPQTQFEGENASYTGKTSKYNKKTVYEVEMTEGRNKGQKRWVPTPPPKVEGPNVIGAMLKIKPEARTGAPVSIAELRKQFDLPKEEFDKRVSQLADEGKIILHRHDYPGGVSDAERNNLVKIGDAYFNAATIPEGKGHVMGFGLGSLQGLFGKKSQAPAEPSDLTLRERLGRKIGTAQSMAQLLNPKTLAANTISNAAFSGAKNAATYAAMPVDRFLSAFTKQRQVATPEMRSQVRDFIDGFTDVYHAVRTGDYKSLADNRYELNSERVFKNKVGGFFEDVMRVGLEGPDRGAFLSAYNDSVQQILAGHAKSKTKFSLDKIHDQAKMEAQQAVFKDSNMLSDAVVGLRNALNKITPFGKKANFGLGDLVGLKYAKTPANLVARGLEYSPLNFANAFYKVGKVLAGKGNTFDQRNASLAFGKAFVGTLGGAGLGAALYAMGVIAQPEQENRGVQAAERGEGLNGYQINLSALKRYAAGGLLAGNLDAGKKQAGDVLMSYDWLQPWAFGLGMGAAAAKAAKGGKANADTLDDVLTQIDAAGSTLTDQSVLKNVRDVLKNGPQATARRIATDLPSSFVPGTLNQVRQIIDDRAREVSHEKGTSGAAREALEKVLNKLPGGSDKLLERKDIVGRSVPSRMQGAGAALVPLPGRFATYNPNPVLTAMQDVGAGTAGVTRKPEESEAQFRTRKARAAEWLNQYGANLVGSAVYQSATPEEKKAAIKYLNGQISKQSDEKRPTLYLFRPGAILQSVRESEREKKRKTAMGQ